MRTELALMALAALASCSELGGSPHPVTFKLVNAGPCVAYIQVSSHLAVSKDGLRLQIEDDCGTCNCESCANCAVCGKDSTMPVRIEPGGTYVDEWDGRVWGPGWRGTCAHDCESAAAAGPGSYVAEVSFGNEAQKSTSETLVSGAVTTTQTFRHAEARTVEIALDTTPFQGQAGSDCPGVL